MARTGGCTAGSAARAMTVAAVAALCLASLPVPAMSQVSPGTPGAVDPRLPAGLESVDTRDVLVTVSTGWIAPRGQPAVLATCPRISPHAFGRNPGLFHYGYYMSPFDGRYSSFWAPPLGREYSAWSPYPGLLYGSYGPAYRGFRWNPIPSTLDPCAQR